jgi:hypothetical protein
VGEVIAPALAGAFFGLLFVSVSGDHKQHKAHPFLMLAHSPFLRNLQIDKYFR